MIAPYYEDELVTLYHGDCLALMVALAREGMRVDHTITDPPYEQEAHTKQTRIKGKEHKHLTSTMDDGAVSKSVLAFDPIGHRRWLYARMIARLTQRWALTFCQLEAAMLWRKAYESGGKRYIRTMTWYKTNGIPQFTGDRPAANYENIVLMHSPSRCRWNGCGRGSVLPHPINGGKDALGSHPTQKPLSLIEELLTLFSDVGDLILDPFAGSGTTGVAAKKHNRRAILIEQNEDYCRLAARRLATTQPQMLLEPQRGEQAALMFDGEY